MLNEQTAVEIIKTPKFKKQIEDAKFVESQLRIYTEEMSRDELDSEPAWKTVKDTIKKRSDKKFDRFIQFARFPLPIVQLSDSVLSDYFKVFEGKNRFFNVAGDRDISKLKEWIAENRPSHWIENQAVSVFKNKPISFVVVDVDANQNPYLINIDSSRIIDAEFKNKNGDLKYICFIHSQTIDERNGITTTFYSVYDEKKYFVFSKPSNSDTYTKESENDHGIGYCPARAFIRTPTNSKNLFKRRVAFSSSLSKMEDWTIFDIARNYVDHYAPFPVTEAPIKKCPNVECQDGKVSQTKIISPESEEMETIWSDCPACGGTDQGTHIFPGTHLGIKVNSDPGKNDGSGVFKMIFPETDKMKYIPEKLDDIELEIRFKTVGVHNFSNEAFNELQVKGSFASMETVLIRTKTELDDLFRWIVKTVARLYYKDINVVVDANFGTEFYLISEDDLQKRFETAKKIGLPVEEQLNLYHQLIETKYKGNTNKTERVKMLIDLDPYPMQSIDECVRLKNESVLDDFQLSLKVNFLKFISKFEAENGTITEFGKRLEYWKRIELIESELKRYNRELLDEKNTRNNPSSGKTDEGDDNEPVVTQEQLQAQANLRGSVGGVQGILEIQRSVSDQITTPEAAIVTLVEIYGFNRETSVKILGISDPNKNV